MMDLIARNSGGFNVVGRPQARPTWYPTERVRPVQAQVYWRYVGEVAASARLIGIFRPGQLVTVPMNPLTDRDLILSTISISAEGIRSVNELADALEQVLPFQRVSGAPDVSQVGASTHDLVTLAIDNFSTLAIKRKIRIADDAAMTINLHEFITVKDPGAVLPRLVDLDRTGTATTAAAFWVRVSHSSGGAYSAESPAQTFSYQDSVGGGGTSGTGDEIYRDRKNLPI